MTATAIATPAPNAGATVDRPSERSEHLLFVHLRASGSPHVREELVARFLPLARSIARRYQRPTESQDDLEQVASLGLLKAIDRFDPERGLAFSSYAVPTIAGEIKRYFRDRSWTVRPPRELQELTLRVDDAAGHLTRALDRSPTVAELAVELGRSEEQILEALQAGRARHGLSMQAPMGAGEDRCTLEDTLSSDDDPMALVDMRILRDGLVSQLSDRNREILRLRFEEDMTQQEIGAIVGISQMQVSRLIRQSLRRMREIADEPALRLPA